MPFVVAGVVELNQSERMSCRLSVLSLRKGSFEREGMHHG